MRVHRVLAALASAGVALLVPVPAAFAAPAETFRVVERQVDVNPGETNPCTGATGTIVNDEQDVFHLTERPDGTVSMTGHSTIKITFTPDDPGEVTYEGHETFAFSESSSSRNFVTTTTSHVRVKGTDGTFVTVRAVSHVIVNPSGATVSFDKATFICS